MASLAESIRAEQTAHARQLDDDETLLAEYEAALGTTQHERDEYRRERDELAARVASQALELRSLRDTRGVPSGRDSGEHVIRSSGGRGPSAAAATPAGGARTGRVAGSFLGGGGGCGGGGAGRVGGDDSVYHSHCLDRSRRVEGDLAASRASEAAERRRAVAAEADARRLADALAAAKATEDWVVGELHGMARGKNARDAARAEHDALGGGYGGGGAGRRRLALEALTWSPLTGNDRRSAAAAGRPQHRVYSPRSMGGGRSQEEAELAEISASFRALGLGPEGTRGGYRLPSIESGYGAGEGRSRSSGGRAVSPGRAGATAAAGEGIGFVDDTAAIWDDEAFRQVHVNVDDKGSEDQKRKLAEFESDHLFLRATLRTTREQDAQEKIKHRLQIIQMNISRECENPCWEHAYPRQDRL